MRGGAGGNSARREGGIEAEVALERSDADFQIDALLPETRYILAQGVDFRIGGHGLINLLETPLYFGDIGLHLTRMRNLGVRGRREEVQIGPGLHAKVHVGHHLLDLGDPSFKS